MKWVKWIEPFDGYGAEALHCKVSIENAIASAKRSAASRGYAYIRDEDALNDFITVHWAYIEDDDES